MQKLKKAIRVVFPFPLPILFINNEVDIKLNYYCRIKLSDGIPNESPKVKRKIAFSSPILLKSQRSASVPMITLRRSGIFWDLQRMMDNIRNVGMDSNNTSMKYRFLSNNIFFFLPSSGSFSKLHMILEATY